MADRYPFREIEEKWQRLWDERQQFRVTEDRSRPKFYCLEMFPYPSGRIHMGHVRVYAIGDLLARYKWMRGYNVLHPMGWDAFGLPAENAAIDNGVHPAIWTSENIDYMRLQLKKMGTSYDWEREVTTCDPAYYKWEQLIFIKMLERGLAYRRRSRVNWCPSCQTVLANEQVEDGRCWRCESEVTPKDIDGWFFKITAYAEELLAWCDRLPGWPERVLTMQRNWIGKSEGAEFDLPIAGRPDLKIRVFTTRPDTVFGMTYAVLAPEHPLVDQVVTPAERAAVEAFRAEVARESEMERTAADRPKRGLRLAAMAVNPFDGAEIPLFIADYVLMGYGTGAIMAVPGEDQRDWDFARRQGLPIIETVERPAGWTGEAYTGDGVKINSGFLDGLTIAEAKRKAIDWLVERGVGEARVNYRLRDWGISRQRYWGAPIPVLYCERCGIVPEAEDRLPVVLPRDVQLSGKGGSPLASAPEFVNARCPRCGGAARRETDTMDTFVESSWYFLRYCSPRYEGGMVDTPAADYWMPVDQYIGGIEHAVLHLLYARFYTKVLRDLGLTKVDEPFTALLSQGMVIKDGAKMSKSKGNVVSDDFIREKYGADTGRLFELFAAPPEKDLEWNDQGIEGASRFLNRVWRFTTSHLGELAEAPRTPAAAATDAGRAFRRVIHETVRRVTDDLERDFGFNTAIAAIMELVNALAVFEAGAGAVSGDAGRERAALLREAVETVILLLGPFCPHIAEELWSQLGHPESVFRQRWPQADPAALVRAEVTLVVQVDGRVRSRVVVEAGAAEERVRQLALADERVQPWLASRRVERVVVVPSRLVNIVTRA
ncbi:MAG: leucine--tRNA ligase [Candidatus Rokubacteria bacterium]|nr:leucine--tRNA ligase [Candidatus Rokubacteria bacterium]MBI3825355.1 leucine--tRNA ligase [Candidatus Rokubacteria bacterium]